MKKKINWNVKLEKERIRKEKENIIIVGAGSNATIVLFWLKDILNSKRIIILDNGGDKIGTSIDFFDYSYEVLATDEYLKNNSNTSSEIFIVSPDKNYIDIEEQILTYNEKADILCWGRREYSEGDYFERRIIDPIIDIEGRYDLLVEDKRELRYEIMEKKKIIISQVIMVLGNVCNLKCKNCSMLMPQMKNKFFVPADTAKKEIAAFMSAVDEVEAFNLIAGETLLYPYMAEIIDFLSADSRIKVITMASNSIGELSSEMIEALRNPKVLVLLSDYGQIEQLSKRVALFEKNGIRFKVIAEQSWINFGDMTCKNKNSDELAWAYTRCFEGDICHTIYDGKLWVCERAARMNMIDESMKFESDYLDLYDDEFKAQLREFLLRKTAECCNYCSACGESVEVLPAGEQLDGNDFKSEYTLVKRKNLEI